MAIKWRLNILMAERYLRNKDLVEATGMHPVTVSKLKNSQEAPERLERSTLEKLCAALNCQPGDLMVWEVDSEASTLTHRDTDDEKLDLESFQKLLGTEQSSRGVETESFLKSQSQE